MRRLAFVSLFILAACKQGDSSAPDSKSKAEPSAEAPSAPAEPEEAEAPQAEAEPEGAAAADDPNAGMASAKVGEKAPDFTLTDLEGKPHKLSDYAGKLVVLEWFNPQCPFVKYAHTEGPLKTMAQEQTGQDVVWLAVNSGGEGKQGHGVEPNREGVETFGMEHPVLLDPSGTVGHAYGAQKTPHLYVIDTEGTLVYQGGIDNAPFGEVDGGGEKVNYVAKALEEVRAGKPVATAETPSYGCTVKYATDA